MGVRHNVLDDEMERQLPSVGMVDSPQEGEELQGWRWRAWHSPMTPHQHLTCGKENHRPMPLSIVRERTRATSRHRQRWLGPIKRLDPALLVGAQHDCLERPFATLSAIVTLRKQRSTVLGKDVGRSIDG
jgi:hypothetical protein